MSKSIGFDPKDIEALDRGFRIFNAQMVTAINGVIVAAGEIAPNIDLGMHRLSRILASVDAAIASAATAQTSERERRWRIARPVFAKAKGLR